MSNEWIKISDRSPTSRDLPVVIAGPGYFKILNALTPSETFHADATHWKEFRDAPPKEDEQEQKDVAFVGIITEAYMRDKSLCGMVDLVRLSLSFERSEIRQLLKRHQCGELPAPEVIREISKRVKLT